MLASVATVALSGCSNEEIANVETSMQNAIGFNVVGSNPGTRATPVNDSEGLKANDFFVFAFETGKTGEDVTPFMGTHVDDYDHNGVEIFWDKTASKWDYKNPAELAYWPTVGLDFYAVTPANAADFWLIHSNEQKIQYTCADEFSSNDVKNVDLMYATAFNQTKEGTNGKVKLTFKHALSQVVFRARTEKEGMEVKVGKMKLFNAVVGQAVFTFPKEGVNATMDNWGLNEAVPGQASSIPVRDVNAEQTTVGYAADSKDATWLSDVKAGEQAGESNVLMMLPQKLTKWTTTPENPVTKTEADQASPKQSYLAIECSIMQNGLYVYGSADELATIYVPFGADWQPGYRYVYTLIFGGGYDADGKPILTPIEFDAEVTPWEDKEIDSNFVTTEQN